MFEYIYKFTKIFEFFIFAIYSNLSAIGAKDMDYYHLLLIHGMMRYITNICLNCNNHSSNLT